MSNALMLGLSPISPRIPIDWTFAGIDPEPPAAASRSALDRRLAAQAQASAAQRDTRPVRGSAPDYDELTQVAMVSAEGTKLVSAGAAVRIWRAEVDRWALLAILRGTPGR